VAGHREEVGELAVAVVGLVVDRDDDPHAVLLRERLQGVDRGVDDASRTPVAACAQLTPVGSLKEMIGLRPPCICFSAHAIALVAVPGLGEGEVLAHVGEVHAGGASRARPR
jgi:hypothetical protein